MRRYISHMKNVIINQIQTYFYCKKILSENAIFHMYSRL